MAEEIKGYCGNGNRAATSPIRLPDGSGFEGSGGWQLSVGVLSYAFDGHDNASKFVQWLTRLAVTAPHGKNDNASKSGRRAVLSRWAVRERAARQNRMQTPSNKAREAILGPFPLPDGCSPTGWSEASGLQQVSTERDVEGPGESTSLDLGRELELDQDALPRPRVSDPPVDEVALVHELGRRRLCRR